MNEITLDSLKEIWKLEIAKSVRASNKNFQISYRCLEFSEFEFYILKMIKELYRDLREAGSHRQHEWQSGWGENLQAFAHSKSNIDAIPKYFNKYDAIRFAGKLIIPIEPSPNAPGGAELSLLTIWIQTLGAIYFEQVDTIMEFGCGTAHNLISLQRIFPDYAFVGLDWANSSQEICQLISKENPSFNLSGLNFDFYSPNYDIRVGSKAAVLTVAALEQVGKDFVPFVNYLKVTKPNIVVNIEPIAEVLDNSNLLDYLSIRYFEKRKYLSGFLQHLQSEQDAGAVEILEVKRSNFGSLFIEGYTAVVWRPI